jgi:Reeler domain
MVIIPDPLSTVYQPNQKIRVSLRPVDSTFTFSAFFIEAHPPFDSSVKVGQWESGALGQPISCSHPEFIGEDAAAQSVLTSRTQQQLVWIAPENPGNYVFNLTTFQQPGTNWIDQISFVLKVEDNDL